MTIATRTMRAAMIREHGDSDRLQLEEVPIPSAAPGDLLIRVGAVGLNHLDVFTRQGLEGPGIPPITLPHVSGVDVAGTVAEGPTAGQRVLVNPAIGCGACRQCRRGEISMCPNYTILGEHRWGGLAEYATVPATNAIPLPDHVEFTVAAALPATYTTAWRGMVTVGRVRPGERVLIVGASGGVGCAALQIGVLVGAEVLATASTSAKRQRALDAVGAPTWRRSIQSLAMAGRMVICGATGGDRPDISIREIYQHHRQILGAPMGNWQDFLDVTRLAFSGKLVPEVHSVYSLARIAEAEDALDRREHFGKIVIQVN